MELGLYGKKELNSNEKCQKRGIKNVLENIGIGKILYYTMMFFSARAGILGGLTPFGAALIAVEYPDGAPLVAVLISLFASVFSATPLPSILRCGASTVLFFISAQKIDTGKSVFPKAIIMSACVFLSGLVQKTVSGLILYDVAMLALEAVLTLAGVYLFSRAKAIVFSPHCAQSFTPEDIICVAALLGTPLIGLKAPEIFGIDPVGCLCVLTALILAYENGVAAGAAAGVTIGLIYGFYLDDPVYIVSSFALSSALCGFFGKYGRAACALSFLPAHLLMAFYSVSFTSLLLKLAEISSATIIFLLLPEKLLSEFFITGEKKRSYADRLRELTYLDISESAEAIGDVAKIFNSVSENRLLGTESAVSSFFEKTARRLCEDCPRLKSCWRNEFHRTYTSFFVMLQICEKNGCISFDDIPEELSSKCMRRDIVCSAVNGMYDVYKVDKLWESRVAESRLMLSRQLMCVSARMAQTAKSVKAGASFDLPAESGLLLYLSENGIKTRRVMASDKCINITLADPDTNISALEDAVSSYTGCKYFTLKKRDKTLSLCRASRLSVSVGKASEAKNQNPYSGDSTDYMYLENDKFFMILSDGMGSGERAGSDSGAAVEIASKMLSAGFGAENTISMINSVLVLKSSETSFATLDMAILDLKRGIADFYKSGAAASFIKRGNDVFPIVSSSLPSGVIAPADVDVTAHKIKSGDILFMVSDGITGTSNAEEICKCISEIEDASPNEMAQKLLKRAAALRANIISDDMTVLTAVLSEAV